MIMLDSRGALGSGLNERAGPRTPDGVNAELRTGESERGNLYLRRPTILGGVQGATFFSKSKVPRVGFPLTGLMRATFACSSWTE